MPGKLKRVGATAKVNAARAPGKIHTSPSAAGAQSPEAVDEVLTSTKPKLTPYQRLQQLLADRSSSAASKRVVTTVEELQEFLRGSNPSDKIEIKMKLLWVSDHTYRQSKLVRLHFTDGTSSETLEAQQALFRDNYDENKEAVDELLFTATIWDTDSRNEMLPRPGCVVKMIEYSSLKLFRDKQCQANAKLSGLSWPTSSSN